ncbi:MAG TPA: hypothetical protein VIL30_09650 [Ramlibacter sp.]|jgi:hypothetical protein
MVARNPSGNNVIPAADDQNRLRMVMEPSALASSGYLSTPTVTRPANTTAYTAGDVVGGAIEFTSIGPAGGHIMVTAVDLAAYIAALPSGIGNIRLHVYSVTPPSALADNAAWDLPAGDRASYLGYIDMGTLLDVGSTCYVQTDGVNKQFKLAAGSSSLFGYLQTINAFTPGSNSEVYMPRLRAISL